MFRDIADKTKLTDCLHNKLKCYIEWPSDLKLHETRDISDTVGDLTNLSKQLERLVKRSHTLRDLPADPVHRHDVDALSTLSKKISATTKGVSNLQNRLSLYKQLPDDLKLHETKAVEDAIGELADLSADLSNLNLKKNVLRDLPSNFAHLHDLSKITELGKSTELAEKEYRTIKEKLFILKGIPNDLITHETDAISYIARSIKNTQQDLEKNDTKLSEIVAAIRSEEEKLNEMVQKSEIICPTCGNHNINLEEVLSK